MRLSCIKGEFLTMPTATCKLLRILPPALALAALGAVCAWQVDGIAARSQGYRDKQVVLNEICAHNLSGLQDGNGAYGDWIELYNPYGGTIDLSGWTLTDDKDDPDRWTFPAGTVLGQYLVLFADGTDTVDPAGYLHTSFGLKTSGETLYLYDADGEPVDHLKYPEQDFDITYGRAFGNGEDAGTFGTATPGAANPSDFLTQEWEAPLGTAEFSLPSGFYEGTVQVSLACDDPEALIFYTTDGSDPADGGNLYTGPIEIGSRAGEANEYVSLPARFGPGYSRFLKSYAYTYAPDPVDKATTITACLYKDGKWSEELSAATYWIDVEPHTLPVVSITTNAEDLFALDGIYLPGTTYYTLMRSDTQEYPANFHSGEEIYANIQFLTEENGSQPALIHVSGGASRNWAQMKNLTVSLLDDASTDLLAADGTQANEEMDGLSLKGPGNGSWQYFYLDGFWSNYLYGQGLGTQYNVPVILYLEDEYWGIYCARESKNEEMIARQYGVEADAIELYEYSGDGEATPMSDMVAALNTIPDDESGWEEINSLYDVDSFIEYLIPQMYTCNWDGLRTSGNVLVWRADRGTSDQYTDGRWRFVLHDMDQTVVYDFMDPIADLLDNPAPEDNLPWNLFCKLWHYREFRERFTERFREELATTYAPQELEEAFLAWCAALEPEMERNITRQKVETTWLAPLADWLTETQTDVENMTMEQWYADRQTICDYFTTRGEYLLGYLETHLAEDS